MSKGVLVQWTACRGWSFSNEQALSSPALGNGRTSYQGYDFKHVTASAAPGQGNRLLQLQQTSRTRVPLTHATVYWSGLRVVACCSGAPGTHTSLCQSVFCLNLQTSPFGLAFFQILLILGVFLAANTGDWHLHSEFITKSIL